MGHSVLIIDAQNEFVNPIADYLRGQGIGALTTADGKDGLAKAQNESPDAIVVCVELPQMSGYSICARLKKDDRLKDVPLVITSAVKETQDGFESHKQLRTRADEYIKKPFSGPQLLHVLEPYLKAERDEDMKTESGLVTKKRSRGNDSESGAGGKTGHRSSDSAARHGSQDLIEKVESVRRGIEDAQSGLSQKPAKTTHSGSEPPSNARALLALKQELSGKEREILELKEKLQKADRDLLARRDQEMEFEARIIQIEEERDAATSAHEGAETRVAGALDKIAQLEISLQEVEKASEEAISAINRQLRESQTREAELKNANQSLTAESTALRTLLAEKETSIANLNANIEALRKQNAAKDTEIIRISDERFAALSEVKSVTEQLAATEAAREVADEEASKLKGLLEKTRQWANSEINTLKNGLAESEKALKARDETIAEHEKRIKENDKQIEQQKKQIEQGQKQAEQHQKQIEQQQKQIEQQQKQSQREIDRLTNELSGANSRAQALQDRLSSSEANVKDLTAKAASLSSELEKTKSEVRALQDKAEQIEKKRASTESQLSQTQDKLSQAQEKLGQAQEKLREEEQSKRKTKESVDKAIALLQALQSTAQEQQQQARAQTTRKGA